MATRQRLHTAQHPFAAAKASMPWARKPQHTP